MAEKILITSDSTCDLSAELKERYNIKTIPLGITLGTEVYRDGIDITPDDIYAHHAKTGELPKTTASNVGECIDFFKPFVDDGYTVIHFTISSSMSSTYNNTCMAASEFDNVYVIDSKNLSTGGGLLVIAAAEMAKSGMAATDIVSEIEKLTACVDASFVIDSLDYLYKGGRCSALSVLGANLLKLKPCIEVKNGSMGVGKKYRGVYGAVLKQYAQERLQNPDDIDTSRVFVTHAGCDAQIVEDIVNQVKETGLFKEVFVTRAGCTISSHCGANTLGVLFIRKSPIA
ncbi:MAG: DegV family protein [Acutalibacteraceae bacterium]|nr:DegV family protein [Acutalibacteraceae bacterium]